MNDSLEIENELKKLRPSQPSRILFDRVEEALMDCRAGASPARQSKRSVYNWWSLGVGLAAAAVFILLARINTDFMRTHRETVPQVSPATGRGSISANQFIPASATEVVYGAVDEGLHFVDGSEAPVRRLRYDTREILQWRNPHTGESLRVSYPIEEVVLFPVSGQ